MNKVFKRLWLHDNKDGATNFTVIPYTTIDSIKIPIDETEENFEEFEEDYENLKRSLSSKVDKDEFNTEIDRLKNDDRLSQFEGIDINQIKADINSKASNSEVQQSFIQMDQLYQSLLSASTIDNIQPSLEFCTSEQLSELDNARQFDTQILDMRTLWPLEVSSTYCMIETSLLQRIFNKLVTENTHTIQDLAR